MDRTMNIPSHKAIVVSNQQKPKTCERRHGREEQSTLKARHGD